MSSAWWGVNTATADAQVLRSDGIMNMETKTILLLAHLTGLTLGLGGVAVLDVYLFRLLRGAKVRRADGELVRFVARLVSLGLALLWVSGLGFLVEYWTANPHLLTNSKLHAKILIVLALTVNGLFLHALVLPLFDRNLDRGLFDGLTVSERLRSLVCAVISATSWYAAFILGTVRELNFTVPLEVFLLVYLVTIGAIASAVAVVARRRVGASAASRQPENAYDSVGE